MAYLPKTYRTDGGDKIVIASGGTLLVESGGTLTIEDGSLAPGDVALADGKLLVGAATGFAAAVDLSGDATISNAGALTIAAGAIDASMLATAVADALPYVTVTAVNQTDGTNDVTIQAKDAAGNDLADVVLVKVWYADTEYGAEDAAATSITATTGTVISSITANATLLVASDASGTIVLSIDDADADPVGYIHAEVNGIVTSAAVTITGS